MVVIGGGSGGLVASLIGSLGKAKVALIEKDRMGGDCLNRGCVPSKSMISCAKVAKTIATGDKFGQRVEGVKVDFNQVRQHVQNVIKKIEPKDSFERYEGLGVKCFHGEAHFIDPWTVKVHDQIITGKNIIIATGSRAASLKAPGSENVNIYNSDTIWDMEELPKILLVIGGGPIGLELSQAFLRLGSKVTVLEMANQILPREDADIAEFLKARLIGDGLNIETGISNLAFFLAG